jgi:hypothetical protein
VISRAALAAGLAGFSSCAGFFFFSFLSFPYCSPLATAVVVVAAAAACGTSTGLVD